MPKELTASLTPVSKEDMFKALWKTWVGLYDAQPKKESIWILLAHVGLETGWMKSMHAYNLGNVRSYENDGYNYCFYECNEILSKAEASKLIAKDPSKAKITQIRPDGKVVVYFYPNHPGSRFRAFPTLVEGVTDWMLLLKKNYSNAWPAVLNGDPVLYCKCLKSRGYFTDDLEHYTQGFVGTFRSVSRLPINYENLPLLTPSEAQRILNLVALTAAESL